MVTWGEQANLGTPWTAAVVGGGPAGCSAAYALARRGVNVVLIERGTAGRDKACGDMFVPSAAQGLMRMGLDERDLLEAGGVSFDEVDLLGARGLLWKVRYHKEPVWILPRRSIDQKLRDKLAAVVDIIYECAVTALIDESQERSPSSLSRGVNWRLVGRSSSDNSQEAVRLGTNARVCPQGISLRCKAVVIASGAQCRLARRWGLGGNPVIMPALSAYVRNPRLCAPAFEFVNDCRPGYRWLFPTPKSVANIGICALGPAKGSTLKTRGTTLLERCALGDIGRWRAAAAALWSGLGRRWHHPAGIVACGDAAGLIDPLNGEGLTAALLSGEAAGSAVANFLLHKQEPKWLEAYSTWVQQTFSDSYAPSPGRIAWRHLCGLPA